MRAVFTREDLIPTAMIFDGLFRAGTVLEAEAILRRVEEDLLPSQFFFLGKCATNILPCQFTGKEANHQLAILPRSLASSAPFRASWPCMYGVENYKGVCSNSLSYLSF